MIEMGKRYQTRDGRAVRILCVDSGLDYPIVGIVIGDAHPETWTAEGILSYNHATTGKDLIPVPTKHEGWVVLSSISRRDCFASFAEAKEFALMACDVVARVTWES